jgi:hypothetical protein
MPREGTEVKLKKHNNNVVPRHNLFYNIYSKAADIILHCALAKEVENGSGKMFRFGREFSSVEPLYKDELASSLWETSEKLVGLKN